MIVVSLRDGLKLQGMKNGNRSGFHRRFFIRPRRGHHNFSRFTIHYSFRARPLRGGQRPPHPLFAEAEIFLQNS